MDEEEILNSLVTLGRDDISKFSTIEKIADWHITEIEQAERAAKVEVLEQALLLKVDGSTMKYSQGHYDRIIELINQNKESVGNKQV